MTDTVLTQPAAPINSWAAATGLLEKVVLTFVEVFLAGLLAADTMGFEGAARWAVPAVAAAGTVLANGLPSTLSLPFSLALLYRTVRTYAVSFLALFAGPAVVGFTAQGAKAAAFAAIPAALTVAKGLVASRLGEQGTPALLPTALDVPPPYNG